MVTIVFEYVMRACKLQGSSDATYELRTGPFFMFALIEDKIVFCFECVSWCFEDRFLLVVLQEIQVL